MAEWVCQKCQIDCCDQCADIVYVVMELPLLCQCNKPDHSGEARDKQILDPETGTTWAPGLIVTKDGEVKFPEPFPKPTEGPSIWEGYSGQ